MMATRHTFGGSPQHYNGNLGQEDAAGMMGQVRSAGEAVQSQAQHAVEDYPLSSVLAVFGIGLGVGVCLGMTMLTSSSNSSNWYPSGSSNWFPSMSGTGSAWLPSGTQRSWFGNGGPSNWSDNLVQGAKNMCGL